jgi:hypothetical protein
MLCRRDFHSRLIKLIQPNQELSMGHAPAKNPAAHAPAAPDKKEEGCHHCGGDKPGEPDKKMEEGHALHAAMHLIDPQSLPNTTGILTKFLYNVHGDSDGFLLDNELQVQFPPHMSTELLKTVKVGERVTVHGVKPRSVDLLVAVSITSANGVVVVDHGIE